jgi:hypothetical protein
MGLLMDLERTLAMKAVDLESERIHRESRIGA